MNADLKILYIDDDTSYHTSIKELLEGEECCGYTLQIECTDSFETGILASSQYHLVILDLYRGQAMQGGENVGSNSYKEIQEKIFIPIIFFSGYPKDVAELRSQVIGVATKGDGGFDELKSEIERLTKNNLPILKEKVHAFIEDEFKKYFWGTIQPKNNIFKPEAEDLSLGYMLLRNMADTLSRDNIQQLLGDDTIKEDKVHPMELYIYPTDTTTEYQTGEIIKNTETNDIFVILTPSCDLVERVRKGVAGRNASFVLLVKTTKLTDTVEYQTFLENPNKDNINKVDSLIRNNTRDRYFFLPQTPFIENRVIDFQNKEIVSYEQLCANFERIAKLDNPYAQSMAATHARYYNRIGCPDIDSEYIINGLLEIVR